MLNTTRILIIDDHPYSCIGYELFLEKAKEEYLIPEIKVESVYTTKEAISKIDSISLEQKRYELVILDIQIPPSPEDKVFSGEDLGFRIRKLNPAVKIIVITSLNDNYRLYNIFKNLNPEGLAIKTDIDDKTFVEAVSNVLTEEPYYSKGFSKLLRNQFSKEYVLNNEDRELLYLLSKGFTSKEIPQHLPWSESLVEKRKKILREKLQVEQKGILPLVNAAKKAGFL